MSSIFNSFRREQVFTCPECDKNFESRVMLKADRKVDHGY
jgi:transposase-like protein